MIRKIEPAKLDTGALQTERSSSSDIDKFLEKASHITAQNRGRLIFALDATMSRQPTWDMATKTQVSMFHAAGNKTGLSVQLVYFRGFGECRAAKWVTNPKTMTSLMTRIECQGGTTQISKVLTHTSKEHRKKRVSALVFIGDAMEEDIDDLCNLAGKLGAQGVRAFMFQEGYDNKTEKTFREIARLSNGAFMRFNSNSSKELEALLSAVASFATGGQHALQSRNDSASRLLLEQLK